MENVEILKQNNIKIPMIIEIALKLGMNLNEFTIQELITQIKTKNYKKY